MFDQRRKLRKMNNINNIKQSNFIVVDIIILLEKLILDFEKIVSDAAKINTGLDITYHVIVIQVRCTYIPVITYIMNRNHIIQFNQSMLFLYSYVLMSL